MAGRTTDLCVPPNMLPNTTTEAMMFRSRLRMGSGTNGAVQRQTVISAAGRNEPRPVWEMIYNHYANRKGLSVPNIAARAQRLRPEGGPNASHASTFDQLGFGTLLYTRPPGAGDSAVLPGGNISDCTYRFMVRHVGKAMTASERQAARISSSEP